MLTLKSKVATPDNLFDLLQRGVTILHISCHGEREDPADPSKTYLEFESSKYLGVLHRFYIKDFLEIFQQVFYQYGSQLTNQRSKPKVIIINACFSGSIAKALLETGV